MFRRTGLSLLLIAAFSLASFAQDTHAEAEKVREIYQQKYSAKLVPMLSEALRFPTVQGNTAARDQQQQWLARVGGELGLTVHPAGLVTEIELPATVPNAPVLGLMVHGDVQPVNESEWTFKPFAGTMKDGVVYGRGAADDKGPLVQALLSMVALRDSGLPRTHTIRLLVGSDEESDNQDVTTYLKDHHAPDLTLVLDSAFPVVVGEKAWTAFSVTAPEAYRVAGNSQGFAIEHLDAGLAVSIVPSHAEAKLVWSGDQSGLDEAVRKLQNFPVPAGYKLNIQRDGSNVTVTAVGHSAHAGVNIEGGRNALVFLAKALDGNVVNNGAADLLKFAGEAGSDIYGSGLGLTTNDPLWGHYAVNAATIKQDDKNPSNLNLVINVRALPAMWGGPLKTHLEKRLAAFNNAHGEHFVGGGFFADPPLAFDPNSKLVKRLMADYSRSTGENPPPAISGGGTYAKRLPNAIAFGMWFPGKPYPGHDVDEQITVRDLNRGVDVLLEALTDIATTPAIREPFKP